MIFTIRSVDRTATGREIVRERTLDQAALSIGRAAENDIPLPDLAIEQRHVEVTPADAGQLRFRALTDLDFVIDGRSSRDATIDPAAGAELELGSYRLQFGGGSGATEVTIRKPEEAASGKDEILGGFALAHVVPGKRPMAWLGLAAILIAFLAIPVWSHLTRDRVEPDIEKPGAVMMDASWSTGSLSTRHHALEENCEACHVEPFVAVRDETCLTCHEGIGDHAAQPRQSVARGAPVGFDAVQWDVAHALNKPGPGACTDCHTEHEGQRRMEPTRERFCADCHGTLDTRLTDTTLGNAGDFGTLHPQFQAAVLTAPGQEEPVRVTMTEQPRHWDGLTFPHRLHLDARGGVTQMARRLGTRNGYGERLQCNDCHRPTLDRTGFRPVNMENDCESCHSLVIDQRAGVFRKVSHGDAEQARTELLALGRANRPPIISGRGRPGQYGTGGRYSVEFGGPATGAALLARAMAKEGLCGECHTPAGARGTLEVMPVTQQERYFLNGWFDHDAHKEEQCTTCHAANRSNASSDLLLPEIGQCRECHEGETSRTAEVPSGCAMCHSFHPRANPAAEPSRIARR